MNCRICDRTAPDAYLCRTCLGEWSNRLLRAANIADNADTYRARIGTSWRFGQAGKSATTPLPYDPRVTPMLKALADAARPIPGVDASTALVVRLRFAATAVLKLGGHAASPSWSAAAKAAIEAAVLVIDSPPDMVYFGRCERCPESLYVEKDTVASYIKCPRCATQYQVESLRKQLLVSVHGHLATKKEISRLLRATLGKVVSEQAIGRLVDKGLLTDHGNRATYDTMGRLRKAALYRIGDVLDLVTPSGVDMEYAERTKRVVSA